MKKILTLLVLAFVATPSSALNCTQWTDSEGIQRWKCEHTRPIVYDNTPREKKTRKDIRVVSHSNGSFTVFNDTDGTAKSCKNILGKIVCR